MWLVHAILGSSAVTWQEAGTHIIVPDDSFSEEYDTPRQKALVLTKQANADRFQRLWILSHQTPEDTKAMTIWFQRIGKDVVTQINHWPDSGAHSFPTGARTVSLVFVISYKNAIKKNKKKTYLVCFPPLNLLQANKLLIHLDFNLRFYS